MAEVSNEAAQRPGNEGRGDLESPTPSTRTRAMTWEPNDNANQAQLQQYKRQQQRGRHEKGERHDNTPTRMAEVSNESKAQITQRQRVE